MKLHVQYLLKRLLWKEFYTYSSEESLDGLKSRLNDLFEQQRYAHGIGLFGEFVTEYEFSVSQRNNFGIGRNPYTRINGLLYELNGRTYVDMVVRPSMQIWIFVIVFTVMAIILAGAWVYYDWDRFIVALLNAFGIMLGAIILVGFVGMVLKDVLRWQFVRLFGLRLVRN